MHFDFHSMKTVEIWSHFWSVFSYIHTEYVDLLSKSPYSVQMQENTDQKQLRIWTLFTQCCFKLLLYPKFFNNGLTFPAQEKRKDVF